MHGSRSVVLKTLLKKHREYNDRNMTDYPSFELVLQGRFPNLTHLVFVVVSSPDHHIKNEVRLVATPLVRVGATYGDETRLMP